MQCSRRRLAAFAALLGSDAWAASATADAAAHVDSATRGQALAAKIQAYYARLPGFRLHFIQRGWDWRVRGQIHVQRGVVSIIWQDRTTTRLDAERGDDAALVPGPNDALALRAKPRDTNQADARMLLFVDPRRFCVQRAQFLESGGVRHRVDFTWAEILEVQSVPRTSP